MARIMLGKQNPLITIHIQERENNWSTCLTIENYGHMSLCAKLSYVIVYTESVN